jgi:hypothetical protein
VYYFDFFIERGGKFEGGVVRKEIKKKIPTNCAMDGFSHKVGLCDNIFSLQGLPVVLYVSICRTLVG